MFNLVLSMGAFALIGAITPGPVNIIATSSGATYGFARTCPHILGATLGYTLVVLSAGLILHGFGGYLPALTEILHYVGGLFLLYMSYRIATMQFADNDHKPVTSPPRLFEGALVQLLNPKAWLVSTSGIALFVSSESDNLQGLLVFCTVSFAMCFIGVGFWAVAGQLIRNLLNTPSRQTALNRTLACLLATTVLLMFAK